MIVLLCLVFLASHFCPWAQFEELGYAFDMIIHFHCLLLHVRIDAQPCVTPHTKYVARPAAGLNDLRLFMSRPFMFVLLSQNHGLILIYTHQHYPWPGKGRN
jgi:hypothetical protein